MPVPSRLTRAVYGRGICKNPASANNPQVLNLANFGVLFKKLVEDTGKPYNEDTDKDEHGGPRRVAFFGVGKAMLNVDYVMHITYSPL